MRLTADLRLPLTGQFFNRWVNKATHGKLRRALGFALMSMVVFEASLFGSGQMLRLGPVTAKMVLFALAVGFMVSTLLSGHPISPGSVGILASLLAVLVIAALMGIINRGREEFIYEDVVPLLYVFILPFFELTIEDRNQLERAVRIILFSSLILCLVYMLMLGALAAGKVTPIDLYMFLQKIGGGDFMYDGLTWRIFYKGSLYLAIAVIILAFRKDRWSRIGLVLCFVSLILTVTRGFVLALLSIALVYAIVRPAKPAAKLAWGVLMLMLSALAIYVTLGLAGDKTESDTVRLITVHQVLERSDWMTILVGHGFGVGVPERPEHMEIAYLEIFYKQGLIGLIWYGSLGGLAAVRFRKAIQAGNGSAAYPFFLTVIFVFVESLTNPFINNPIGLSAILISLAGLRVLTKGARSERNGATIAHA